MAKSIYSPEKDHRWENVATSRLIDVRNTLRARDVKITDNETWKGFEEGESHSQNTLDAVF